VALSGVPVLGDDGDPAISAPPPPCPSQIGVGLREFIPRASQIGVHFSDWGSIGVGLKRDVAALCLYLQPSTPPPTPYVHPIPPKVTQSWGPPTRAVFVWWGWKAPKNRQRVATPKRQNATESPLRILLFPTPSTNNQVPADRYPTASLLLSHARTSSPAEDMSFATLCLN
jgi:hypothetical protein